MSDIRYGLRQMRRSPGFTAVVLLTLGIGIGANTMIFSFVKGMLFPPIPFDDDVVLLRMSNPEQGWRDMGALHADIDLWRSARSFEAVAAADYRTLRWAGSDHPRMLRALETSSEFFQVLGTPPALGRSYTADEIADGAKVALLADSFWRSALGADPGVIGRSMRFDGVPYTIVGVAAAAAGAYDEWKERDLFLPLSLPADLGRKGGHNFLAVAKLAPGASIGSAQVEVEALNARVVAEHPETSRGFRVHVRGAREYLVPADARRAMAVLAAAVVFVLTLASANVANLLLSRAAGRSHEIAVRAALGAGRGRIVRQVLTESLLLALAAGGVGAVLATWGISLLVPLLPDFVSGRDVIAVDAAALLFTLGAAALTALLFGLAPALHASRAGLQDLLREGPRGGGGARRRTRAVLMTVEVGLAVILLIGAGLAVQSFSRLRGVPRGFDTEDLLVATVRLPGEVYPDAAARSGFFHELVRRAAALPGVAGAAAMNTLPLYGSNAWTRVSIEGAPVADESVRQAAGYMVVTPGYFDVMRIGLREGAVLSEAQTADAPPVAVINESMARRYWPDGSAVGRRFKRGPEDSERPWVTVIGVVGDNLHRGLDQPPRPEIFLPLAQESQPVMQVVLRSVSGAPLLLEEPLRAAVAGLDPEQPVFNVYTMDQVLAEGLAIWPLVVSVLSLFSAVALALACLGVYSVMSYAVSRRTREMAIRMALGAEAGDVIWMVLRGGLAVVSLGLLAGVLAALGLTQVLRDLLFGIEPTDPATFASMSGLLLLVTLLACYVPARRATRVDPIAALRVE